MLGVLIGLLVGGAVALIAELLDISFKKVEDIERVLNLPVVGITPKIEFLKQLKH